MNNELFNHNIQIRVRNFEVDSQGIVHNAVYLNYFETGRVEYRRELGYNMLPGGIFDDGLKVVVVRNEINYKCPAYLDDLLNVYTRVEWIKNSSFCFDQFIENDGTGKLICDCKGILVNLDNEGEPLRLNDKFREELKNFDSNIKFISNGK
jgi:YbgC/YbaW family acyl-CoA thioester hydrolase